VKQMKAALLTLPIPVVLSLSLAQEAFTARGPATEPAVLRDGAGAKYKRVQSMHQVR
jgi:hypothetical protein